MAYDPPPIPQNLKESERKLWDDYNYQISHGQRKTLAPKTLRKLIENLKGYSKEETRSWFTTLFEKELDKSSIEAQYTSSLQSTISDVPFPILNEIVATEVNRGYLNDEPDYARWLGQLYNLRTNSQILLHDTLLKGLVITDISAIPFFQKALNQNPQDLRASYLLISEYFTELSFAFGELPYIVWGGKEWQDKMLAKLEQFSKEAELFEKFRKWLAYWHFHADAWDDYQKHSDVYASYRSYLAKHPNQ